MVFPHNVLLDELRVGDVVTARMQLPRAGAEPIIQTGPIEAIEAHGFGLYTFTINGVDFFAMSSDNSFTQITRPEPALPEAPPFVVPGAPLGEFPDLPQEPGENPEGVANAAAVAAAPAEEEDVLSSLEPSPMPSHDLPGYEEPAENPAPKSAPPTPQRPPRKGGKRTRKHRTPRRKRNAVRKSTYRVSRRR